MRWLKKREVVMIYLLNSKFKDASFTYFEALAVLEKVFGRKVARNRLKYFIKSGIIIKVSEDKYRVLSMNEIVEQLALSYIIRRSQLLHRRTQ